MDQEISLTKSSPRKTCAETSFKVEGMGKISVPQKTLTEENCGWAGTRRQCYVINAVYLLLSLAQLDQRFVIREQPLKMPFERLEWRWLGIWFRCIVASDPIGLAITHPPVPWLAQSPIQLHIDATPCTAPKAALPQIFNQCLLLVCFMLKLSLLLIVLEIFSAEWNLLCFPGE